MARPAVTMILLAILLALAHRSPIGGLELVSHAAAQVGVTATPTPTSNATPVPTLPFFSGAPTGTATVSGTFTTAQPQVAAPVVSGAAPRVGLAVSVTTLSVTGSNFAPGAVAYLGGRALQTTVASSTQLIATVPAGMGAGSFPLTVASQGVVSAPLVDAISIVNLASIQYAPVVLKQVAGSSTGIQVQNLSSTTNTVYVIYYNRDGYADPAWVESRSIPPGGSATYYQPDNVTLPLGFDGSAVIQSTQPSAAVVNRTRLPGDIVTLPPPPDYYPPAPILAVPVVTPVIPPPIPPQNATLIPGLLPPLLTPIPGVVPPTPTMVLSYGPTDDTAPGLLTAGAYTAPSGTMAKTVAVPVVFGGFNGYRSTMSVQNTGDAVSDYTVALYPVGSTAPITSFQVTIPPLASRRVRLGSDIGVPPDFVGTALISSPTSRLTAIAETLQPANGLMFSYSGIASGDTAQHTPLLYKNFVGWVSGAQVVNVSVNDVVVNATLRQRGGALGFALPPRTLRPNESFTYYLPSLEELPDGFVGLGTFTASGAITVVVQHVNIDRGEVMAYNGFSRGTPNISLPLLFKNASDWNTGVEIQNLGAVDTLVTLSYFVPNGPIVTETALVPAGNSTTFYQRDNPQLPDGFIGSGVATNSNSQPIVAVVNEVNFERSGDAAMAYEGINY